MRPKVQQDETVSHALWSMDAFDSDQCIRSGFIFTGRATLIKSTVPWPDTFCTKTSSYTVRHQAIGFATAHLLASPNSLVAIYAPGEISPLSLLSVLHTRTPGPATRRHKTSLPPRYPLVHPAPSPLPLSIAGFHGAARCVCSARRRLRRFG
ncbi:hypothetical protein BDU57DRAFT_197690 [Ampelomyces quisqualis]|uniref:Uncharacterized protein n=1 Tax=Ampelomyces quisqualis TaxID=50730 RepID=A0A6A5QRK6_AMPQU|nr:hypothetical protein BDU57DRAFT_197690 [Ampelomyces quisqualis]